MSQWTNQEEWNARMLEALVNIYTLLNKHEAIVETANMAVTEKIMVIMFEVDGKDEKGKLKVDEAKRREEPQYDLWTQKDFDNMRKAIPYANPDNVRDLLKALKMLREDQNDTLELNRKGAWNDLCDRFNEATINSQCNYSDLILGSITNLLTYFGKRTGFQSQNMDKIDHAMADEQAKRQRKTAESEGI